MSLIITATDFTPVAETAVNYACRLAMDLDAEILVLHCYTFPVVFSDMPIPSPVNDMDRIAEDSMKALLERLHSAYPQVSIKGSVIYGDIQEAIDEFSELNESPVLVVIGNHYSVDNPAWHESTLMDVFRHLRFPVLAIPAETVYQKVKKIGFAYDNKYAGSSLALIELREIVKLLNAELHVFFDVPDLLVDESFGKINDAALNILSSAEPLYHVFYEKNIDEAIAGFIDKYNTDWLTIIPRKHSFFERLFRKSHTLSLVNNSHLPILALHEVQETR
ncbi:MAG: universal stress protein [Taibaiella sp.]|nr:universal stress protein [Taibaiella sp.]